MPEHVRVNLPRQARSPRERSEELVERPRAHRRSQRVPGQVHQHEVTPARGPARIPVEPVTVVGEHQQFVDWNRAGAARFRPGSVGVVPALDVQVSAGDRATEQGGVADQVHVLAAQPGHLAAAQPGPGQGHHDEAVTGRPARPQQPQHLGVAGAVDHCLGLRQAVARARDIPQAGGLAADLDRQMPVVGDVIQRGEHLAGHLAHHDRMPDKPADHAQDPVDPAWAARP